MDNEWENMTPEEFAKWVAEGITPELTDRQKAFVLWICGLSLTDVNTLGLIVDAASDYWGKPDQKARYIWQIIQAREYEVPAPPDVLAVVVKG